MNYIGLNIVLVTFLIGPLPVQADDIQTKGTIEGQLVYLGPEYGAWEVNYTTLNYPTAINPYNGQLAYVLPYNTSTIPPIINNIQFIVPSVEPYPVTQNIAPMFTTSSIPINLWSPGQKLPEGNTNQNTSSASQVNLTPTEPHDPSDNPHK